MYQGAHCFNGAVTEMASDEGSELSGSSTSDLTGDRTRCDRYWVSSCALLRCGHEVDPTGERAKRRKGYRVLSRDHQCLSVSGSG